MTDEIINEYNKVKTLIGHQPSSTEFFNHSPVTKRALAKAFGKNAFSKLAEACGDMPNVFSSNKSKLDDIFQQYGELARELKRLPIAVEWDNTNYKPTVNGIERSHKFRWGDMPIKFLEFASDKSEWADVVALIPLQNKVEKNIGDTSSGECFVYLMLDSKTRFYKIGISKTAEYREKTLRSEQPSIKLIAKKLFVNRRMAASFEKALHETYSHKRKRGEWFLLNESDVKELTVTLNN